MARVTIVVEVPDIVASALTKALDESSRVLICPESIHPGYVGEIIEQVD